jgi:hypothetical protein
MDEEMEMQEMAAVPSPVSCTTGGDTHGLPWIADGCTQRIRQCVHLCVLAILRTNGALHTAASAFDVDQLLLRIMWHGMGQGQWTLHLWREDTTADGLSRLDATVDGSKKYR